MGLRKTRIFLQKGLDRKIGATPVGQITPAGWVEPFAKAEIVAVADGTVHDLFKSQEVEKNNNSRFILLRRADFRSTFGHEVDFPHIEPLEDVADRCVKRGRGATSDRRPRSACGGAHR